MFGSCFLFAGILSGRVNWQKIKGTAVPGTWEADTQKDDDTHGANRSTPFLRFFSSPPGFYSLEKQFIHYLLQLSSQWNWSKLRLEKKMSCHLGFDRFQLIFCLVVFVQRILVLPPPSCISEPVRD